MAVVAAEGFLGADVLTVVERDVATVAVGETESGVVSRGCDDFGIFAVAASTGDAGSVSVTFSVTVEFSVVTTPPRWPSTVTAVALVTSASAVEAAELVLERPPAEVPFSVLWSGIGGSWATVEFSWSMESEENMPGEKIVVELSEAFRLAVAGPVLAVAGPALAVAGPALAVAGSALAVAGPMLAVVDVLLLTSIGCNMRVIS